MTNDMFVYSIFPTDILLRLLALFAILTSAAAQTCYWPDGKRLIYLYIWKKESKGVTQNSPSNNSLSSQEMWRVNTLPVTQSDHTACVVAKTQEQPASQTGCASFWWTGALIEAHVRTELGMT